MSHLDLTGTYSLIEAREDERSARGPPCGSPARHGVRPAFSMGGAEARKGLSFHDGFHGPLSDRAVHRP